MRRLVPLLLVLTLGGCAAQFAYNQLDRALPWLLDDYLDLTGPQYDLLQTRMSAQLCWHRVTQLPVYADWLRRAEAGLRDGMTAEDLDRFEGELWVYWKTMMGRVAPDLAQVMAGLSDKQIAELAERLELKNLEFAAERVKPTATEQRSRMARDLRRHFERWVGSLTDGQKQEVQDWSEEVELTSTLRLAARRAWQAQLLAALRERQDRARLASALSELLVNPASSRTADYQRRLDNNTALTKSLILSLLPTLSARQKAYFTKRVLGLAEDFDELAADDNVPAECALAVSR